MKKLKSSFLNMTLVLTAITMISAATLGAIFDVTQEPIELTKKAKMDAAIQQVLPQYSRLDTAIVVNEQKVYKAFDAQNHLVGLAIETWETGFSGVVKIMVGVDVHGNIVDYSLLEHSETPGLGSKLVDWFKVKSDIRGLSISKAPFSVSKDGGECDAITAATISSRAFLRALNKAVDTYNSCLDKAEAEHPDAFTEATTVAFRRMRDRAANHAPLDSCIVTPSQTADSTVNVISGASVQQNNDTIKPVLDHE